MSSDVTIEVTQADLVRFDSTIVTFAVTFGKELGEVLRQQARLIAVNLAWNTQPYGLGQDSLKKGQAAVIRDVGKVYRSIDTFFAAIAAKDQRAAKAFVKAARAGDRATVARLLVDFGFGNLKSAPIGPFDGGTLHRKNRDRRGRVPVRGPLLIVTNPRELAKYTKARVAAVGTGKSAWATCARQLGSVRGIPLWATRNRAQGSVEDFSGNADNPRVILRGDVDYMPTICPPDMQRDAVEKQRNKMQTAIRSALDRSARSSRLAA